MSRSGDASVHAPVALLTDFGLRDGYVGVMQGVMLGIAPHLQYVDITHAIAPQDVAAAARVLATSYRFFPVGSVFLCVVDPGVGSMRRPVALHAGSWFFVGPDNGLFHFVLAEQTLHTAVVLTDPAYHLPVVSATFQGRDIFAPVAAYLASGVPIERLGTRVDPASLTRSTADLPVRQGDMVTARIVQIDHFGNVITDLAVRSWPDLCSRSDAVLSFPRQGLRISERRRYFAEYAGPPEADTQPFIYEDSSGYLAVAIRNASAADRLGVRRGDAITFGIASE